MTTRIVSAQPSDNTPRAVAAGTVLLLPAAAQLDGAAALAAAFLVAAGVARAAARLARSWPPSAAYVLVFTAVGLAVGLLYQVLLTTHFALATRIELSVGLLIANPAVYVIALGRRDGVDPGAPPALTSALVPVLVLLSVAFVIFTVAPDVAILAQPAGWLLAGGLVLAATRARLRPGIGENGD